MSSVLKYAFVDMVKEIGPEILLGLILAALVGAITPIGILIKQYLAVCCTSSNALKVVQNIDAKKIIFIPDRNLASYVSEFTDKEIIPYNGYCYIHNRIREEEIKKAKEIHPDAVVLVHPECRPEVIKLADEVASTGGMIKFAKESKIRKTLCSFYFWRWRRKASLREQNLRVL